MGYKSNDDLQFYFYEVIGDTAYISGELKITHIELQKKQFHVIVVNEELTKKDV